MAFTVGNHYFNLVSRPSTYTVELWMYAEWWGNDGYDINNRGFEGIGYGVMSNWTVDTTTQPVSGYWYSSLAGNPVVAVDIILTWRPYCQLFGFGYVYGPYRADKTHSVAASASAPTVASITANSAVVSCNYFPNVTASTATAQLQYKRTVDSTWIDFGTAQTTPGGYAQTSIASVPLPGLLSSTSYDVRLNITRNTLDNQTVIGAVTSFQTLAGEPEVTTTAATAVAATAATLNLTVIRNAGTNAQVYWKWGTNNPPTQNTTTTVPVVSDGLYSLGIIGLSGGQTYYAQAFVSFNAPPGTPNNGLVVSFNTPVDPALEAAEEDHMQVFEFNERKYGVSSTINFAVASPATTSSDRFFNNASPFVAGDVTISKDGGAFVNVGTLPVRIGTSPNFALTLDGATEMNASTIVVMIVDQDGPVFRDAMLVVRTVQELGGVDIDASQKTNASAFKVTGVGTGHGIEAVGGATGQDINGIMAEHFQRVSVCQTNADGSKVKLDAGASGTNDYYNGSIAMIVGGTGVGQARVGVDYDGTTKEITVDSAWATIPTAGSVCLLFGGSRAWDLSPAVELAAVPGSTASYGSKLQFLFQRFAFKITQTATLQTWFKANSSTALATRSVDDDGVLQTIAKLV